MYRFIEYHYAPALHWWHVLNIPLPEILTDGDRETVCALIQMANHHKLIPFSLQGELSLRKIPTCTHCHFLHRQIHALGLSLALLWEQSSVPGESYLF